MTLELFLSRGNNRWLGWKRITQTVYFRWKIKWLENLGVLGIMGEELPWNWNLTVSIPIHIPSICHIPYTIYQNMSYTSTRVVKVLFGVLKNSGYCWVPQYTQIFWTLKCLCIHIGVQFSTGLIPAVDHTWYKPDNQLTTTQYHWWITNKLL